MVTPRVNDRRQLRPVWLRTREIGWTHPRTSTLMACRVRGPFSAVRIPLSVSTRWFAEKGRSCELAPPVDLPSPDPELFSVVAHPVNNTAIINKVNSRYFRITPPPFVCKVVLGYFF